MEKLTIQEEEIMLIIWKQNGGIIKDFIGDLPQPLPYTTVASIVKNLERKQYVISTKVGNAFSYSPNITLEHYKQYFMDGVVEDYFNDSYKNLVNFFIQKEKIDVAEIEEILEMIKKGKS